MSELEIKTADLAVELSKKLDKHEESLKHLSELAKSLTEVCKLLNEKIERLVK